jgi:hypothetical protein
VWKGAAADGSRFSVNLWTYEDSNKLWVIGLNIDVVEDVFPSKWCWPDDLKKVPEVPAGLAWHHKCLELARVSEKRTQDYLEDYLLTLTAGILDSSPDGNLNWHRQTPWNQSKETFYRMVLFLEGWVVQEFNLPFDMEFISWAANIKNHCTNRAFFTTKQERISLGPSSMIKGDKICVFKGMP